MSTVINIENLSKKFVIGHEEKEKYTALRDVIAKKAKGIFSFRGTNKTKYAKEDFWVLKDINFSIDKGDRVGIIGRNGAGKSTLLKVLSRITEPTKGRITIAGRVASLLEVGTGFHPELTGRENIFLNGAVLGMSRVEIRQKFDEIVAFAEVERFLDTPVKRYSSGMYVRLAFAVAAHLEPEIMIVDEVLAVGDAQFQKKCLGKMEDVSKNEGRTVLFVSHNMGIIGQLCNRGILLEKGQLRMADNMLKVINEYTNLGAGTQDGYFSPENNRNQIYFASIQTLSKDELFTRTLLFDQDILIKAKIVIQQKTKSFLVGLALLNVYKVKVFTSHFKIDTDTLQDKNEVTLTCRIPQNTIVPGQYSFDAALFRQGEEGFEYLTDICSIEIVDSGHSMSYDSNYGSVFVQCAWNIA
jgi:lipopolysaccharide transport system ATP-binding protein